MVKLTPQEKLLLLKLLYKVDDEDSDVIDLMELLTRNEFKLAGTLIEKLKQDSEGVAVLSVGD